MLFLLFVLSVLIPEEEADKVIEIEEEEEMVDKLEVEPTIAGDEDE